MKQTMTRGNGQISWLLKVLQLIIFPCILLLAWEFSVRWGWLPETLIAYPSQVVVKFFVMLTDGRLLEHSLISLKRLFLGFSLGTTLGIIMGTLVGYSRFSARLFEPSILGLIPVPPIAWIPLLVIVFGIGEASKIALISIGSFCTLFLQASYGIRSADKELVEVAYVLEKSDWSLLLKILLPSALPSILSSMRVAMALSWTLLMASEIIASSKGLGWLMWDSRNFSRPDDMIVGMVAVGILGKITDSMLVALEKYLTRWRQTYRNA
ncbi:ABC transporter permease [Crocosphaera sp. Alani8]|uniref:ABC transporter permease n=1 Tax=Crocosphaera sp. Alani8 TaxID=3038952 RepID=UPI00313DBDB4